MRGVNFDRDFLVRAFLLIVASTFVLTASFVGILAIISDAASTLGSRIPFYLIVMGLAFVITILLLEEHRNEGRVIILTATVVSSIIFITTLLSAEGLLYAVRHPEKVFVSQLVFYFIAAGLIGTGFGYWGIRHWREFTGTSTEGL